MNNTTDTNQASEGELRTLDDILSQAFTDGASDTMWQNDRHIEIFATAKEELLALIRTEKLKLLDKFEIAVAHEINDAIRTEKLKLLSELDKSMSTTEQLTTKYGYHTPERMYGYKLALNDIREAMAKLEANL